MKINPGFRPFGKEMLKTDPPGNQPIAAKSFSDTMNQHQEKATMEQLNRKLEEIQRQGERLSRSMTVRELRQYRLLVKAFLEETVRRGVVIKDTRGWDRRGRQKRYKLIEEIDKSLLDMADEMLENEQGKIDLLHKIGEIRGMLINLFF